MAYQYRTFSTTKENPIFDQFDLYFYKPKSTTLGVKVRFSQQERYLPYWDVEYLECKFINNIPNIREGKEKIEKWKKLTISSKFRVYTREYIAKHMKQFQEDETVPLDQIISKELKHLNKKIIKSLKEMPIKEKHLERNPELRNWLQKQQKLQEIFLVQKSRRKILHQQTGIVKAFGLYSNKQQQAPKTFKTVACESSSQKEVQGLMQKLGLKGKQNISYPSFIEMISIGLL